MMPSFLMDFVKQSAIDEYMAVPSCRIIRQFSIEESSFSIEEPSFSIEKPSFSIEKPSFSIEKPSFSIEKPSFLHKTDLQDRHILHA